MRLAADAAHQFGGIELDRSRPLSFRLDGRTIEGFAGDTVLSALLAAGIDTYGRLDDGLVRLGESFAPLVALKGSDPLPMERLPVIDGLDLSSIGKRSAFPFGQRNSLRHALGPRELPWSGVPAAETLTTELLIVGGGVAGLAAAEAAVAAGRSVILVERRPWLGGDGRYFGPLGDEESPEALIVRLVAQLGSSPGVALLANTEVFSLGDTGALGHRIDIVDGRARGQIVAITASRILLATGAAQRLPVFAGNRLPGVVPAIEAYHLAKRYGVARGPTAIVATQSNYGYRLAMRLNDAGIAIRRIVDTRVNPQSRFVDFSKASGLNLGSGQVPVSAAATRHGVSVAFANAGMSGVAQSLEAAALIVSGGFQPDLALWMLAGGGAQWSNARLEATGHLAHVGIAGSAAGYRTMRACAESGRATQAELFGEAKRPLADVEIDASFETPDAPTSIGPATTGAAFLDGGWSFVRRGHVTAGQALSLGDVTAAVDLGTIAHDDAGALAEERGAPGGDLVASAWTPAPAPMPAEQPWLAGRFGADPVRVHLMVDDRRVFEPGALVYANTARREPASAIGVIIESATPGGVALMAGAALRRMDRFVVETLEGPSPARKLS